MALQRNNLFIGLQGPNGEILLPPTNIESPPPSMYGMSIDDETSRLIIGSVIDAIRAGAITTDQDPYEYAVGVAHDAMREEAALLETQVLENLTLIDISAN